MKQKLEDRKKELEAQFNDLKAKQDQHINETNNIQQQLLLLNGAYQEIERQLKELEETPNEN